MQRVLQLLRERSDRHAVDAELTQNNATRVVHRSRRFNLAEHQHDGENVGERQWDHNRKMQCDEFSERQCGLKFKWEREREVSFDHYERDRVVAENLESEARAAEYVAGEEFEVEIEAAVGEPIKAIREIAVDEVLEHDEQRIRDEREHIEVLAAQVDADGAIWENCE